MDVRITFLNGNLEDEVYMDQLKDGIHRICRLKKRIYKIK